MMAGLAKEPSPLEDWLEDEYLEMAPSTYSCDEIKEIILLLKAQVAWRYSDLNANDPDDPSGKIYKDHKVRIKRLEEIIKLLESYIVKLEFFGECR